MEKIIQNRAIDNDIKSSSDTLLVLDNETNKIEMVKDIDSSGKIQKIAPENKKADEPLIRVINTAISFPTSFLTFTDSLKTHRVSAFSKFRNMMPSTQQRIFSTM